MAYDPEKDKVLKTWKCNETGLLVSINRYGDGEAKVQIGPRILLKKDGSQRAPGQPSPWPGSRPHAAEDGSQRPPAAVRRKPGAAQDCSQRATAPAAGPGSECENQCLPP